VRGPLCAQRDLFPSLFFRDFFILSIFILFFEKKIFLFFLNLNKIFKKIFKKNRKICFIPHMISDALPVGPRPPRVGPVAAEEPAGAPSRGGSPRAQPDLQAQRGPALPGFTFTIWGIVF
jgi:hypothetical protein